MGPEGSLPQSHVPATCPYPEPVRSSRCPTSHFLKIHLNLNLPSTPSSSKWCLSLRLTNQNPACTSPLPHTCYMPRPSHSSRFYHPNNIWCGGEAIKLLTVWFSPLPCLAQIFSSAIYSQTSVTFVPPPL